MNPYKKYTNTNPQNIQNKNPTSTPQINDILESKKVENDPTKRIEVKRNIKNENIPKKEIKQEIKIEKEEDKDTIFDSLLDDESLNPNIDMGSANFNSNKKINKNNNEPKKESAASIIKKSIENQSQNQNKNDVIKNSFFGNNEKLNPIKKKQGEFISGYYENKDNYKNPFNDLEAEVNKKIGSVIEKNDENDELLLKNLEIEKERKEQLKKYMEMIVKMKKEKRKKVEEDYLTQEQQKRLELRKELAETLKASIKK
jgi:hypothetical protein